MASLPKVDFLPASAARTRELKSGDPPRYERGTEGFAVLSGRGCPLCWGSVMSHRGLELRIRDQATGKTYCIHPKYFYPS